MIHRFILFNTNMVLDVNSGGLFEFDEVSYEVAGLYEGNNLESITGILSGKFSKENIAEAYHEIDQLVNEGRLFSEDISEDYFREAMSATDKSNPVKAMCLHIAHDCNLRCRYCFASTGGFGHERTMMSSEVAVKAIDFLVARSGSRRNLEVDFFGGEPLMNFETVMDTVRYARSIEKEAGKNFRFTITTNAMLLDEQKKQFINENMDNLVLSIDGREDTNDHMRIRVDGTGTYQKIIGKIVDMAESRNQDKYYVRGTFTRKNLDFSKDVIHLANLGFKQISIEPVVAEPGSGYDIRDEDLPQIFSEYEKLAFEYVNRIKIGNSFNFFHFMIDLENGPCAIKRSKGCGSGDEYVAVTPEGDIYPCHQFAGNDELKMGNVNDSIEINEEIRKRFRAVNIYTKKDCSECWAKFYCSGGCVANSYQYAGGLDTPYKIGCEMQKKRLECALWVKVQETYA